MMHTGFDPRTTSPPSAYPVEKRGGFDVRTERSDDPFGDPLYRGSALSDAAAARRKRRLLDVLLCALAMPAWVNCRPKGGKRGLFPDEKAPFLCSKAGLAVTVRLFQMHPA